MKEGYPQKQAIAIAYSYENRRSKRNSKRKSKNKRNTKRISKTQSCKNGSLKRPIRTNSGKIRRCKNTNRKSNRKTKTKRHTKRNRRVNRRNK